MNKAGVTAIAIWVGCISLPAASAETKLGRLFLTPERRSALEQQRQYNLKEQKSLEGANVRLDGVILRSSGKKTVWINGHPQHDNNSDLGVSAKVSPNDAAAVGLSAAGETPARLRVGQQINRATREINDGIGGGRLEVKPPPPKH